MTSFMVLPVTMRYLEHQEQSQTSLCFVNQKQKQFPQVEPNFSFLNWHVLKTEGLPQTKTVSLSWT